MRHQRRFDGDDDDAVGPDDGRRDARRPLEAAARLRHDVGLQHVGALAQTLGVLHALLRQRVGLGRLEPHLANHGPHFTLAFTFGIIPTRGSRFFQKENQNHCMANMLLMPLAFTFGIIPTRGSRFLFFFLRISKSLHGQYVPDAIGNKKPRNTNSTIIE